MRMGGRMASESEEGKASLGSSSEEDTSRMRVVWVSSRRSPQYARPADPSTLARPLFRERQRNRQCRSGLARRVLRSSLDLRPFPVGARPGHRDGFPSPCGRRAAMRSLWAGPRSGRGPRDEGGKGVRIGFDHYTIGPRMLSPGATLEFARAHGLDGVQFLDPETIDPTLDPDRLAAFR